MKAVRRFLLVAAALAAGAVSAQSYPTKPVKLVVGFPAGGPADIFGRSFAQALGTALGQTVIVENKSGVGGVLGIDAVAKSAPDGYTLGFNNQGSVAMAPYALSKMPFNPNKDLAFITTVVRVPEVVVVNPSLPVNTLAELIAYAKANPGKINFGSAGAGGITHLACELLKSEAHIDVVHVPYKGAAPAVSDLLGGQVQMGIFDVPVVLPHIKSGKFRALAVTSARRAPPLPEVQTTGELGYPRVISDNWYGRGHAGRGAEAHPRGRGRGAPFAGAARSVRQGGRHPRALVAGRIPEIPRRGAGALGRHHQGDRLQGRHLGRGRWRSRSRPTSPRPAGRS
jgi:tripartite-type tricarboxylate transporter receptor subunit TctC